MPRYSGNKNTEGIPPPVQTCESRLEYQQESLYMETKQPVPSTCKEDFCEQDASIETEAFLSEEKSWIYTVRFSLRVGNKRKCGFSACYKKWMTHIDRKKACRQRNKMAVKTFCPVTKPQDVDKYNREDEGRDCLQQFPCCPACNQDYGIALILPCSHTMCGRCVAAAEGTRSCQPLRRGPQQSVCSVLCPCCRHHVELPCWAWSSATSCLPKHPTLTCERVRGETSFREGSPEHHLQRVQREEAAQTSLHCSKAASSPVKPEDGAIDLQEEEMERSVFGLHFALDPSTAPPSLHLSNSSLTVTYHRQSPPAPPPENKIRKSTMSPDPRVLFHVCADVVIARGQYYWEVDVCNSSIYRIGVTSSDGSAGWWLERQGSSFCAVYDGSCEPVCTVPPQIKTLGVFLNIGGGTLSFYNPLTQEHLTTLPTSFRPAGVLPALGLGQGRLRLRCGLPPPPHVFLSKDSAYRGPCRAIGVPWHREVPFQSVRRVIQKFEELALSDSDSGLVSSFGSSCSTLASLPDVAIPGSFPSDQAGEESGAE